MKVKALDCIYATATCWRDKTLVFFGVPGSGKTSISVLLALESRSFIADDVLKLSREDGKLFVSKSDRCARVLRSELDKQVYERAKKVLEISECWELEDKLEEHIKADGPNKSQVTHIINLNHSDAYRDGVYKLNHMEFTRSGFWIFNADFVGFPPEERANELYNKFCELVKNDGIEYLVVPFVDSLFERERMLKEALENPSLLKKTLP